MEKAYDPRTIPVRSPLRSPSDPRLALVGKTMNSYKLKEIEYIYSISFNLYEFIVLPTSARRGSDGDRNGDRTGIVRGSYAFSILTSQCKTGIAFQVTE